ncbi:MAG: IS1380 family transposase, partial [Methylococcaceae bacterium]|nr:IS1380 family transposase [Methylococcaceae bacterium]
MAQDIALRNQTPLKRFILQQSTELLTPCAGLALVGLALNRLAQVRQTLDRWLPKRSGLSVGELVIAYVGLLCLGKSDFDAIENHRQ